MNVLCKLHEYLAFRILEIMCKKLMVHPAVGARGEVTGVIKIQRMHPLGSADVFREL